MPDDERHKLRETFEEAPELYDRARPSYPEELFDDLVALARLAPGARILELGPGTGKATLPLAERAFEIVGVELGEGLATVARRNLSAFPNVEIVTERFETWETDARFDAVVAFTAFHWIDPDVKYAKSARLLHDGGSLAVVTTKHVEGSDPFWAEVQEDYDTVVPSDENAPPPPPDEVPDLSEEIEASGCFSNVAARRYLWDAPYTPDEYLAVLDTYSGHRSLPEEQRGRLYERIRRRVGDRIVRKTYLFVLNVAARADDYPTRSRP
jgi:SAM-dependent methyltransferase